MTITNIKNFGKANPLEDFLSTYKDQIKGKRGFYILSFQMDKGKKDRLFKIGVAHRSIYARLRSYIVSYGENDDKCNGVYIHYLGITSYNRNIKTSNSAIAKLEKKMINALQEYKVPRGKERFRLSVSKIKSILNENVGKVKDDKSVVNNYNLKSKVKLK